ncbi:MAG: AbrB/MazE/SpoVT family DNA-binding domain-containing protein [Silvibacterium sp.]|nr:AbrB/MazE/SpoVT family DNA-binding domain-containing protein [Silvibacterium sp.]MBV8438687.1 AbrB/MazE/SpoVT family DNA-binding domain-containing protein [Silvibacterium sp.]
MAATAVISSKGQIVIPAALRKKYRLKEGTVVAFREEAGHLVLEPDPFAAVLALAGSLKGRNLEKMLMDERRKEREREEKRATLYSRR